MDVDIHAWEDLGINKGRGRFLPFSDGHSSGKKYFYAPEAHIMYLKVSSSFLISFVMGGSGPSRVIKFLNAPERPEHGD
jgi:hypothetical protein